MHARARTHTHIRTQPNNTKVENFGRMRYERSREALAHGRILTQRHEATEAELAMAEGDRPLVRVLCVYCCVRAAMQLWSSHAVPCHARSCLCGDNPVCLFVGQRRRGGV